MVSLASLLTDPNCSSPMNGEAAKEYSKNRKAYDKKVKEWVALHAKSTDVSYENDFGDGKPSSSSPAAKAKSKAKASPKKSPKAKSYDFFLQTLQRSLKRATKFENKFIIPLSITLLCKLQTTTGPLRRKAAVRSCSRIAMMTARRSAVRPKFGVALAFFLA